MTGTTERARASARKTLFTDKGLTRQRPVPDRQLVIWDAKQPGLSLLVSANTKAFRATFKLRGKWITTVIGRFGDDMDIGTARDRTAEFRASAKKGIDPREPEPSTLTYGTVVADFIRLYATPRQRTWQQTERILKSAGASWLDKPIADITKRDAQKLIDDWIAAGQPYKAKLAAAWWRTMWRWAWKREFVVAPIMDALEVEFAKRVRNRIYSDDEIRTIWSAADSIDPVRGGFFKLLLLLGPRKSALAGMRWSDVKNDTWTTPHELTKSRKTAPPRVYLTPLPPLAQRILKGLPRVDGDDRVFAGMSAPRTKLAQQLIRHGAPGDFGYHTCRHTLASWLQTHGHSQYEVGLVLNHSNAGVTSGYSHGYPLELKLKLLTLWSDHIAGLVQPAGVTVFR